LPPFNQGLFFDDQTKFGYNWKRKLVQPVLHIVFLKHPFKNLFVTYFSFHYQMDLFYA